MSAIVFSAGLASCTGSASSLDPAASGGNGGAALAGFGADSGFAGSLAAGAAGNAGTSSGGQTGNPNSTGGAGGLGVSGASSAGSTGAGSRPTVTAAAGTTLVRVDPGVHHQTFEGWGTSLCWWANHVGGWSASARNAVADAVTDPVNGLGYNVFRYNIRGGENPAHEHMGPYHEMPGFEPAAGTWTWDADANQRAILQRVAASGKDVILEAFSNSPPYWLTKSGCASGNSDGSNNLKDDAYDAFADYLTEVVKHYRETYGITFRTIEPLNEPNANWWKADGNQEGCHFSPANQQMIVSAVAAKLAEKSMSYTTVSASDENSIDDAYNNLRAFSAATFSALSQLNTHSYAGTHRSDLLALATSKGKRLWQSESGPLSQKLADDSEAALFMAGRIITDLRELQPTAWVDWQVGDPSANWASFKLNDTAQSFTPLKRFYMHAGFSRYIRPGAIFIEVDNADMVAALSADGRSLTLVVRNGDTIASKGFTFDLTALPDVGTNADGYRTSRTENSAPLAPAAIRDFSFVARVPAFSITTFVIPIP